jgi:hypothetical protein
LLLLQFKVFHTNQKGNSNCTGPSSNQRNFLLSSLRRAKPALIQAHLCPASTNRTQISQKRLCQATEPRSAPTKQRRNIVEFLTAFGQLESNRTKKSSRSITGNKGTYPTKPPKDILDRHNSQIQEQRIFNHGLSSHKKTHTLNKLPRQEART